MRRPRAAISLIAAVLWLMAVAIGSTSAASPSPTAPPAGPPFPEPVDGQAVYDYAGIFKSSTVTQAEQIIDAIEAQTKAEIVVYTQALGRDDITPDEAEKQAADLMDEWGVGRAGINDGLVILFDLDTTLKHGQVQLYAGSGFASSYLSQSQLQTIYDSDMAPLLHNGDMDSGLLLGLARVIAGTLDASTPPGSSGASAPPPGPPFPSPETDRAVYDFAGIFSADAIVKAEATIDAIEARTGAEVVVYTQDSGGYPTTDETNAKAFALMNDWGVGRKGFDDGLVIFFDMQPNLQHGQVQLFAGPGFEAAFLSNSERQSIFDDDMVPDLQENTRPAWSRGASSTPCSASSARRSSSWGSPAGRCSIGAGSARTRSISTTRRS
jgi:uncharacterized membrane protein YgcG